MTKYEFLYSIIIIIIIMIYIIIIIKQLNVITFLFRLWRLAIRSEQYKNTLYIYWYEIEYHHVIFCFVSKPKEIAFLELYSFFSTIVIAMARARGITRLTNGEFTFSLFFFGCVRMLVDCDMGIILHRIACL